MDRGDARICRSYVRVGLHQPAEIQKRVIGDLKLFELKTICPLFTLRDREGR